MDKIGEWVSGKRSDLFRRHGMLRKFSPALLDALEFTPDIEGEQSACLRALQMLKELNATGRRKQLNGIFPTGGTTACGCNEILFRCGYGIVRSKKKS